MAPIYHPLSVLEKRKPNARVKQPFKHHQGQVSLQDDFDPGEGFKALSALATWQVAQLVGREQPTQDKKKYGQLWKGRLKPLYPVRVDGPDITQCQGVMPTTNRVTVSPSRQQQRRRAAHKLAHAAQGGVAYRPRTVESVHNTSRASSPFTEERDTVMKGPSDLSTRSKVPGSTTTPTLIGTSLVHFQYVNDDLSSVRSGSLSAHESVRQSPAHAGGGARPSPRLLTTRPQTAPSHLKPRVRFADSQNLRVRVQSAGVRASEDATAKHGLRPGSGRSASSRGSLESGMRAEPARVDATDEARPASMDSVREGAWQRPNFYEDTAEERPTSAEPMEIEVRGESIQRPGSSAVKDDDSRRPASVEMQRPVSKESVERPRSHLDEALERPVSAQSAQSSHSSLQSAGSVTLQALRRDSADSHASGDGETPPPDTQNLNPERQKEVDLLSEKGIVIRPLSTSRLSFRMDTPWPEDLDPNARPFSGSKILARQGTPVQEGQGETAVREQGQGDAGEGRLETDSRTDGQERRKNSVTFAAGIPLPESRASEMEMKSKETSDLAESGLSKPEMTLEEMAERPLPESRTESVKSFASAKSMPEKSLKKESEIRRHSDPHDVTMGSSDVTLDADVTKPEVEESEITVVNIDRSSSAAASAYAADVESTKSATTQPIFSVPPTRDWESKLGVVHSAGVSRTTTKTDGRLSQSANSRTMFRDPREMSNMALLPNLQTESSSYATTTDIPSSPDQKGVRISERVEEIPKKPVAEEEMNYGKPEGEDDVRKTEASRAESTISTLSATPEPTKFGSYIPSAPRGSIRSASRQDTETPGKDRTNRTHSGMGSRTDDEDLLIDYDVGSDVTSLNLDEDEDFLDSGASPIEYDDEAIMGTKRSYDDTIEERSSEMSTPKNPSRAKSDISDPTMKTDPVDETEKADEAEPDPGKEKSEACQDDFKEVAKRDEDEDDDEGPGDHVTRDQTYVTSQAASQSEAKSPAQSEGGSENKGSGTQRGGQNDAVVDARVQHVGGGFRALRRPVSAKTSPPKMPTPRRYARPQSAKARRPVKNSPHSAKSRPASSKSRPSSSKVSRPKSASSAIEKKMEYLQIIATPCRSSKPESRVCSYCGQRRNEFVESSNTSRFCICSLCYKKYHENELKEDKMWKIQDSFFEKVTAWESGPKIDENETSLDEEEKNLGVYDDSDSGHESESEFNESESTFENESNCESESGWVSEHIGNMKSRTKIGQRRTSIENGKTVLLPYEVEKLKMKVNQKSAMTSEEAEEKSDRLELTSKKLEREAQPSLPSVVPLCFRITHSPPEGFLFYFAYGLDLNKNRMSMYTGRQMDRSLWGVLFGFKLCFNKRVSDLSCGGFPAVTSEQGQSVEGAVYIITRDELKIMDRFVGYPQHYHHVMLPVWACNSPAPAEHGVAQYCLPALLYVARDEWLCDVTTGQDDVTGGLDCSGSARQCLKYGDGLTDKYREHLERLVKA